MLKYKKIHEDLLYKIQNEIYKPGEKIPTEDQLAKQYNVSRKTARHAVEMLFCEGYIVRETKIGSFVADKKENVSVTIAVILPSEEGNNFRLLDAIMENNSRYGYKIEVFYSKSNTLREDNLLSVCLEKHYNGIIFIPSSDDKDLGMLSQIILSKIPIVLVDMPIIGLDLPIVRADNCSGFYELVNYYIQNGKKKIAFATIHEHMNPTGRERYKGYCKAHIDNNIPIRGEYVFRSKYFGEEFYHLSSNLQMRTRERHADNVFRQYEALSDKPDVICFVNDASAYDFIQYVKKYYPQETEKYDISGFDDLDICKKENFTTVRQNFYKLGKQALVMLTALMRGEKVKSMTQLIPVTLKIRGKDTNIKK